MDKPAKQNEPEGRCENELDNGYAKPALEQLAQAWDKEAAECSKNVSTRALNCHGTLRDSSALARRPTDRR